MATTGTEVGKVRDVFVAEMERELATARQAGFSEKAQAAFSDNTQAAFSDNTQAAFSDNTQAAAFSEAGGPRP